MDQNTRKSCNADDLLRQKATNPLMMELYDLVDEINLAVKRHEGHMPDLFQKSIDADINKIIRSCKEWLKEQPMKAAGEYLHQFYKEEPSLDDVRKVIAAFPEALLCKNELGNIPIQTASREIIGNRYIPLLANEAYQRNIGPERGGLLLPYYEIYREPNTLQSLACDRGGEMCLQAFKDLRSNGLLLDQDIARYNLIGNASHNKKCFKSLDYFLEIYPKALSIPQPNNRDLPIHPSNFSYNTYLPIKPSLDVFRKLLTAGMEHYPKKLGFLFQPNAKGQMPITQAIAKYGKDETLQVIQDVIPSTQDCPILHHVFQYTPELCEDFVHRYPDAVSFKDGQGRSFLHVTMGNGMKLSDSVLTAICNGGCTGEMDPLTGLYPFMLAAASGHGNDNDLTSVYKLLVFCPDVISWCSSDDDDNDVDDGTDQTTCDENLYPLVLSDAFFLVPFV